MCSVYPALPTLKPQPQEIEKSRNRESRRAVQAGPGGRPSTTPSGPVLANER